MKRLVVLGVVLALGLAALITAEKRKAAARVGPEAVLYFVADTEHEITRLPVSYGHLSDRREVEIGDRLAEHYSYLSHIDKSDIDAQALQDYVSRVGANVAVHAHRKLPYKFHYIPQRGFINAFALPGGHVYIGSGLMALMDSEDELAAILAHEVEHIDHYHCAERVQVEASARRLRIGALSGLLTIPLEVFQVGYSKAQELEADGEGARVMVASSYSPLGAIRILEAFEVKHREVEETPPSPQDEAGRLIWSTIEGYFRTHPSTEDRVAQLKRMIADEHWDNLTKEEPFRLGYIFWTADADRELEAHKYEHAAALAKHSLEIKPDQPNAMLILGHAEFALADFASAADVYRHFLDLKPLDNLGAQAFADALYAARDRAAATKYQQWISSREVPADSLVLADLAGLRLVSGDGLAAKDLAQKAAQVAAALAPDVFARLGWWYYRAGQYEEADRLLTLATEQRPAGSDYQVQLAWVRLDQKRYSTAIRIFDRVGGVAIGRAVARWQGNDVDAALNDFVAGSYSEPQWLNAKWVQALFSPTVSRSIAEMKVEQEKRELARKARH